MKFNNRNIYIGKNVSIGANVKIGDNTSIYDNVVIDDNCIICDNCSIGEPLGDYYKTQYENPCLHIGRKSLIRSNSVIYAGSSIGDNLQTGHYAIIRENNVLGRNCMVGNHTTILTGCHIGDYCRFHSYNEIGECSVIDDYVFLYPNVLLSADPTPPSNTIDSIHIGSFSQIASNVMLMPGADVGCHCLIGACSKVGGKVRDYSFVNGNPAKRVCDIRDLPIICKETGNPQYPWPYNFSRNMPWDGIGFEEWSKLNNVIIE